MLKLQISPAERRLIDRAAEAAGKTCTGFILEAACCAAEEALLDRARRMVSSDAFKEFLIRLDQPARPNGRLVRTMHSKTPWGAA
jgi:uncharacterized protein (DUF1778 family)